MTKRTVTIIVAIIAALGLIISNAISNPGNHDQTTVINNRNELIVKTDDVDTNKKEIDRKASKSQIVITKPEEKPITSGNTQNNYSKDNVQNNRRSNNNVQNNYKGGNTQNNHTSGNTQEN